MTMRPERILLCEVNGKTAWVVPLPGEPRPDQTEYIRSDVVERLLREARQQERERCAAVCDAANVVGGAIDGATTCARRIRALTDDDTKGGGDESALSQSYDDQEGPG